MKAKITIVLVYVLSLLCACATNTNVPESVVVREITGIDRYTRYELDHNYDEDAHIDDVQVTLYDEGKYGTEITQYVLSFQYDKASDLWKKTDKFPSSYEYSNEWNCEAIIKGSPWKGEKSGFGTGYSYSINIQSVDLSKMTVRAEYTIDFESGYKETVSGTGEYALEEGHRSLYFEIEMGKGLLSDKFRISFNAHDGVVVKETY